MLGALSGLPRSEPILDELRDLLERNAHVRAVRDTIEANWGTVEARFDDLVSNLADTPAFDDPLLKAANEKVHATATSLQPLGYPMYVRLKVSSAVDAFAGAACVVCDYTDASNQAVLVRALVRAWARSRGLFEHEGAPTEQQLKFVADFDLAYAQRRLQFVIDGVSWLYRDLATPAFPSRQQLDALKERLCEAVAKLE
jgi:hypothetical protein